MDLPDATANEVQLRQRVQELEAKLAQSASDLDNLLVSTDKRVIFLDAQLRVRRFTSAISGSFYVTTRDIGRPISEIGTSLHYPNLIPDLHRVLESNRSIERELRDQAGAWILLRVCPYHTPAGAVDGVFLTCNDITATRSAQQDLRLSESNFREMADFVDAIFWLTSLDGATHYYVSPGYEKIWKRSLEELCSNPDSWLDALHPQDRESLIHSFTTRKLDEAWEEQYRILWPDGSLRWIRDRRYPVRDASGHLIRLAGISVDVTEFKRSRQSLELTQFAIDHAGDMVFWTHPDGQILYANDAAVRSLAYSRDALLSMRLPQLDSRRPSSAWSEFVSRLQVEGFLTSESLFLTSDGREIPVEINSTIVCFDEIPYCCAIARDITQRRHSERELARYARDLELANERLNLRNRELDEFAYLASHDLKEPLRAITTFSGLLTQDLGPDLPDIAARDLDFITAAATRMQRLINDLLALSRAGRAELDPAPVSLHACATSALDAIACSIRESGAEIRIPPSLPTVTGDATMLTQLFQNLLSNALKFRAGHPPVIEITATNGGGAWTFGVRDNGLGIKSEYAEKIFQPFRRAHVHSGQEGTGIGLAICRKVVERHGGRIWVVSTPGSGSHFLFTLAGALPESAGAR